MAGGLVTIVTMCAQALKELPESLMDLKERELAQYWAYTSWGRVGF